MTLFPQRNPSQISDGTNKEPDLSEIKFNDLPKDSGDEVATASQQLGLNFVLPTTHSLCNPVDIDFSLFAPNKNLNIEVTLSTFRVLICLKN